ncbi:serine O-acetyltransferase [Vibrio alginolyticus]
MTIKELVRLIKLDVAQSGNSYLNSFFNANVRAVISYRINRYVYESISKKLAFIMHNRDRLKYSVDIYPSADIGPGFVVAHIGGIVIGAKVKIGSNFTIQSNTTIGQKNTNSGVPSIGENVYLGAGSRILGSVKVGSNVLIGANSVVVHDTRDNVTIVGAPAKEIISDDEE